MILCEILRHVDHNMFTLFLHHDSQTSLLSNVDTPQTPSLTSYLPFQVFRAVNREISSPYMVFLNMLVCRQSYTEFMCIAY